MKEKNKEKKLPYNTFRKGIVAGIMGLTLGLGAFGLTACSDGKDGQNGLNGSQWYTGTETPVATQGVNGDFYLDTDDYKLYQKENGEWVLKMNNFGKPGDNGESVYVGYDGHIWNGLTRTEFKAEVDETEAQNVVENTISIKDNMARYYAGEYVDLSSNTMALMSNYKPNAGLTQYSGTKVTEIQVVSENGGTLHIGTAKVTDVVTARTTGTTYTANTTEKTLVAGLNTITLDLTVAEDETIVLGGSGSTAKVYVVKNIPVSDEQGNYALVNGSTNTEVISKTGDYANTLAVRVKAEMESKAVFEDLSTTYSSPTGENIKAVSLNGCPYRYWDNSKIQGRTITKIGAIVKENNAGSAQPYMTVYKCKVSDTTQFSTKGTAIKIYFPAGSQANTWAYADCNIELAEDETIAFGADSGDTLLWGYDNTAAVNQYNFQNNSSYTKITAAQLLFDVYAQDSWSNHLAELAEKEETAPLRRSL